MSDEARIWVRVDEPGGAKDVVLKTPRNPWTDQLDLGDEIVVTIGGELTTVEVIRCLTVIEGGTPCPSS